MFAHIAYYFIFVNMIFNPRKGILVLYESINERTESFVFKFFIEKNEKKTIFYHTVNLSLSANICFDRTEPIVLFSEFLRGLEPIHWTYRDP